jgi:hypothetical protein
MNQKAEQPQDRREMCRDAVRYLALGGIVLLSGGLITRDVGRGRSDRCPNTGAVVRLPQEQHLVCRDCAALAECPLPAAAAARTGNRAVR